MVLTKTIRNFGGEGPGGRASSANASVGELKCDVPFFSLASSSGVLLFFCKVRVPDLPGVKMIFKSKRIITPFAAIYRTTVSILPSDSAALMIVRSTGTSAAPSCSRSVVSLAWKKCISSAYVRTLR